MQQLSKIGKKYYVIQSCSKRKKNMNLSCKQDFDTDAYLIYQIFFSKEIIMLIYIA